MTILDPHTFICRSDLRNKWTVGVDPFTSCWQRNFVMHQASDIDKIQIFSFQNQKSTQSKPCGSGRKRVPNRGTTPQRRKRPLRWAETATPTTPAVSWASSSSVSTAARAAVYPWRPGTSPRDCSSTIRGSMVGLISSNITWACSLGGTLPSMGRGSSKQLPKRVR